MMLNGFLLKEKSWEELKFDQGVLRLSLQKYTPLWNVVGKNFLALERGVADVVRSLSALIDVIDFNR